MSQRITIAYGDGIGTEIMEATLKIMEAAGAQLEYDVIEIGERVYNMGIQAGISPDSWDILRRNKVFLKSPITTPQGGGFKSLNVTVRKSLGLFANVRPCQAFPPYVPTHFPKMDLVVIRENEEDLYAGIEHRQTAEVIQCLKLVSRPGCEKVIRYAFEYARAYNRKRVTCMTKDNIMKYTDGLFHKVFNEIAAEYPDIENNHYIIDIGAAMLADKPERFDVVVTLNLYGDIISDITAEVAGSVGMGGSANIGDDFAMFEAIHGSAPDIAGKGIANPSGLLNGACMMLVHIGQASVAEDIQNALMKTLEDGIHTGDIYTEGQSKKRVGTAEFADAIIERLGNKPQQLKPVAYNKNQPPIHIKITPTPRVNKKLVGVDVFLDYTANNRNPNMLGDALRPLAGDLMYLKLITNRGVKVYPDGQPETFCTDHWRCRFVALDAELSLVYQGTGATRPINHADITTLLQNIANAGFDFIKTENLYWINGERAYSLGQGE
ncbi:MAG TPA: NADP-dependent isocitrate dehydrogenase [Chitinophagales bacterium]|nr:NADP-dependent isocitrate dehydrogenase [Chitinophagales bacterium]HRK27485.1 NADP-dependent isocitrate dehydrogenase [Chitinophagales bacterium]